MNASFRIAGLTGKSVAQAFPLIQAIWPDIELRAWRSFVQFFDERAGEGETGVLALYDPAGYISGVLAYRLDHELRAGPVLAVHLFTPIDLATSLATVRALLDAAESRARVLGCSGMHIRLHKDQARLAARLNRLGMSSEHRLFWATVEPPQPHH